MEHMSNNERKIYDLVVRRFISVLYPAFEYEQTSLEAKAAGQTFAANGKTVISAGWKAVYEEGMQEEDTEDNALKDQKLPVFRQGDSIHNTPCFSHAPLCSSCGGKVPRTASGFSVVPALLLSIFQSAYLQNQQSLLSFAWLFQSHFYASFRHNGYCVLWSGIVLQG